MCLWEKYVYEVVGKDGRGFIGESAEVVPLLPDLCKTFFEKLLNDYPYLYLLLEELAQCNLVESSLACRAIDSILGSLACTTVTLEEKLYTSSLQEMEEKWGSPAVLHWACEERIFARYQDTSVRATLRDCDGSVHTTYDLCAHSLLACFLREFGMRCKNLYSPSAPSTPPDQLAERHIELLTIKPPAGFRTALANNSLQQKPDKNTFKAVSSIRNDLSTQLYEERSRVLHSCGLQDVVIQNLLPRMCDNNYTSLLTAFFSENNLFSASFESLAQHLHIRLKSNEYAEMVRSYPQDIGISPADWLFCNLDSACLRKAHAILPDTPLLPDQRFDTLPLQYLERSVAGIVWKRETPLNLASVRTALQLDGILSTERNANYLWYHGTSLPYAEEIISGGISVNKDPRCRLNLEFGTTRSFYLHNDPQVALAHAKSKFNRHPLLCHAILVHIAPPPTSLSIIPGMHGIDLSNLEDSDVKAEWEKLVSCFCRAVSCPLVTAANNADWVCGPTPAFSGEVNSKEGEKKENLKELIPVPRYPPPCLQLALKSKSACEYFDLRLIGLIIFPPSSLTGNQTIKSKKKKKKRANNL
jgi:hypothetical protein